MVLDKRIWCGRFDNVLYYIIGMTSRYHHAVLHVIVIRHASSIFPRNVRAPVYISCDVRPPIVSSGYGTRGKTCSYDKRTYFTGDTCLSFAQVRNES